MDLEKRLEAAEVENDTLRERIRVLEGLLAGDGWLPPFEWGLTGKEARLMGALVFRPLVTKDAAMSALYRDFDQDEPGVKIVDVFICKLRKKVKPFGVDIRTRWGNGYFLNTDQRKALSVGAVSIELPMAQEMGGGQ